MELNYKGQNWTFINIDKDFSYVDSVTDDFNITNNGIFVDVDNWDIVKDINNVKYQENRILAYTKVGKNIVNVRVSRDRKKYTVYINDKKMDILDTFGKALFKAESYNFVVD